MRMTRRILVFAVGVMFVAGCSGGGEEVTAPTTTAAVSTAAPTTAAPDQTSTIPDEPEAAATEPVVVGIDAIDLVTPSSGGGIRPLLEWAPVGDAASYLVIVYTETGDPYWSAFTEQPSVFVGGPAQIPIGRSGPAVAPGYTWAVYANDADGAMIAASGLGEISP